MDRQTVYFGQLARETDALLAQQNTMVALAKFCSAVLGATTIVNGFAVTPTTPASLNILVGAGEVYQLENIEQSTWSSLPTNTNTILKQGMVQTATQFGITPPGTSGFSQVFLVEVQYQDVDSGATVLPYYNAANPQVPFSGPGNAGTAQNTVRQGIAAIQVKAGVAATTGTQVAPTQDAGWTGVYTITVANGASSITAGNIAQVVSAPFIPCTLPNIPTNVQAGTWLYAPDTSAGGVPPSTTSSTTTASAVLTFSGGVPAYVVAGMKAFDLSTPGAITGGQTVLSTTGTTVTLSGNVNATVNSGDQIAFSNNAYVASATPVPTQLTIGMTIHMRAQGTNTGVATLNLNGLGAQAIHRANGSAVAAGDINANMVVELIWDGSAWQIANYFGFSSSTVNNNTFTLTIPYAADSSATPNSLVAAFSPALTSLAAGQEIMVKAANTNTGPTTVTCNALAAKAVVNGDGTPLTASAFVAGEMLWLLYDGTNFQLTHHLGPTYLTANQNFYINPSTGSDSNDGLSPTVTGGHGPWATLYHARDVINTFNLNGFGIQVNLADGTYNITSGNVFIVPYAAGSGGIVWQGNNTTPSNVVISATNQSAIGVQGGTHTFNGMKVTTSGTTVNGDTGCGFNISNGTSTVFLNNINYGSVYGAHICIDRSARAQLLGTQTISGSPAGNAFQTGAFVDAFESATIEVNSTSLPSLSITTPITVQTFIASLENANAIVFFSSITGAGNVTGQKYSATINGIINSGGNGTNYFPGTVAGSTASGGQYV